MPYDTATAVDLTASITGVHTSIAVASAPAHGTTSITGDVVTYTPTAGYFGADSFTYTATGPGGTSAPATVSVMVATPAAPTVAARSAAVPYDTATAVDLTASITGVHTGIAVASAPAHGTTSIAGDVVTYTPTAGYFGADSFTYTATGPGGTSAPATVSVMVATRQRRRLPPGARRLPYNTATAVDLTASITGVHTSIAVASAPAHGTTSIAGDVVTYTPTAGYFGADSFTYTATGPGGTSAPATVSVTVATAGSADGCRQERGGAVRHGDGGGTSPRRSPASTPASRLASAPAHGTTSITGDVVTYTPTAGYFGADSFTYTATGPGGTSAPATVSVMVATPAAPTVAARSAAVPYDTATAVDLTASITGVHTSIAVASAPAHGTTSIAGDVVTYTPTAGYFGADSFTYTATGPGGTSAPATVSVMVATPAAPTVAARSAAVPYNTATAVDLTASITGVHTSIAVASAPAHGTTSIAGDVVTYTPTAGYFGADSFTYTADRPRRDLGSGDGERDGGDAGSADGCRQERGGCRTIRRRRWDLTASITGVHTSIAVASAPAHGTTSIAGDVVTYTPTAGYFGADSFTYTATGPGGTSAPATVSVMVATPAAPTVCRQERGGAVRHGDGG